MKRSLYLLLTLPALAACSGVPAGAYYNRGGPESLLDMSSEAVTVSLASASGVEELTNWVNQEQPTRATLDCNTIDPNCSAARNALEQFGVPYEFGGSGGNSAMLYYERVLARDCENRFIDNTSNPYNLHHPAFGCSIAANMVQQVTDKRQFINPSLLDFHDAEKAVSNVRAYQAGEGLTESEGGSASSEVNLLQSF